jgi:hypothetical protein
MVGKSTTEIINASIVKIIVPEIGFILNFSLCLLRIIANKAIIKVTIQPTI